MTPSEIRDVLNEVEQTLPVASWSHDGVPVWPVFRIWFVFAHDTFARRETSAARPTLLRQIATSAGHYARARARDHAHDAAIAPADALFLTHATCRGFQVDGRWYDQYCDPIVELLAQRGYRSLLLEHTPNGEYRVPRASSSVLIQPMLSAIAVTSGLRARTAVAGERELQAYFAHHHPEVVLDLREVRRRVFTIRGYADYFARILARVRPKIGFVVNYYDPQAMGFALACFEARTPSVDLQHGVQGELHMAYSRWRAVPPGGYAVLPRWFWSWSEDDARAIRDWSAAVDPAHRAFVGGNVILSSFMRDGAGVVEIFDREVAALVRPDAPNVLVTLRPGAGVPPLIRAAIIAAPAHWTWWVRLHPGMFAERDSVIAALGDLPGRRILIDEATRLPLYALLRHMAVHVTEISSAVLDADQFGVPSVLCHPTGVDYYGGIARAAVGAFTAPEIVAAITDHLARALPRRSVVTLDADTLAAFVERA